MSTKWKSNFSAVPKATYFEGMATPQRFLFGGLTGTNHTVKFDMQWTKAGAHAYDWPVSWAQSVVLAQSIGHFAMTPFTTRCADLNPGDTANCNLATITQTANVPSDPYISGQFGLPATDGSTSTKIAAFAAVYGTPQVQIISDPPITFTVQTIPVHSVANGADTGDSTVTYTLNVTKTGATDPTVLLLLFAAHIAISDAPGDPSAPGTTWGQGFGAKNISGAPYHVNGPNIDGSGGNQDNQLNLSGDPLTPSLVTRISKFSGPFGTVVSDTVTMTLSSSTVLSGHLDFYVCGPSPLGSNSPCLPTNNITRTLVSSHTISTTGTSVTRSSNNFTPTSGNSRWCFLIQWINNDFNSQSWESFTTTNECVDIASPTAVRLSSMRALRGENSVMLNWVTGSEINTAGFNLYRAESKDGPYTRINAQLIPASTNGVTGARYQYEDATVLPGTSYYYQLEDVELNGKSTRHDPIALNAPETTASNNAGLIALGVGLGAFVLIGGGLVALIKKINLF